MQNWVNWKFGIPFSFKDGDGDPKINFELIVQEVTKNHSAGLSIGLPIENF